MNALSVIVQKTTAKETRNEVPDPSPLWQRKSKIRSEVGRARARGARRGVIRMRAGAREGAEVVVEREVGEGEGSKLRRVGISIPAFCT